MHLVLGPKERFEAGGAGAFALNVLETSQVSRWGPCITVFGSPVTRPFSGVVFQPLAPSRWSLRGRNLAMAKRYFEAVKYEFPDLVEIFNRPVMVDYLAKRLSSVPFVVHFGNDPRQMEGSRSVAQRLALLARCAAIVCVSRFIRRCFLDGIAGSLHERVHVIHTGVERPAEFSAHKKRKIVFVGRIVRDKGVLELVRALTRVLPGNRAWSAEIIGARWFGNGPRTSTYENEVAGAAAECDRIVVGGFRPHEQVVSALRGASIAVVPSLWDDPFPRTALEALAQGCALVCSDRGGLAEIGRHRALFLENISVDSIADALERLMSNDSERLALQRRGWEDFPFEVSRTTRQLDDLRAAIMERRP